MKTHQGPDVDSRRWRIEPFSGGREAWLVYAINPPPLTEALRDAWRQGWLLASVADTAVYIRDPEFGPALRNRLARI